MPGTGVAAASFRASLLGFTVITPRPTAAESGDRTMGGLTHLLEVLRTQYIILRPMFVIDRYKPMRAESEKISSFLTIY